MPSSNPASPSDIEARWRPLTDSQAGVASTRLDDGWRRLRREVPDLETRMSGDQDLTEDVIQILSDAVIRVLQAGQTDGYRKGTVGVDDANRTWELDESLRFDLYFTDFEIALLTATPIGVKRAFSLMPS